MFSPRVTIIVFVHAPNARYLPACLESLVSQSYPFLEIVILGDGSQDITEAAASFKEDNRVRVCSEHDLLARTPVRDCPTPVLQAANVCMKESQAPFLATWNGDDIYNRDHVKVLVDILEQYPEVGAVFDQVECFPGAWREQGSLDGEVKSDADLPLQRYSGEKPTSTTFSLQELFRANTMTGPSSLVRRSAFEQVGGYDKDVFFNADLHWFYRIGAYFSIRSVDYVGVFKRLHPGNTTMKIPHYEHGVKELENIRDGYPEVYARIGPRLFNKKLGRKYFRLGLYYERNGQREKAREMYKKAMALRKWSFRYHWEYVRSMLMFAS